MRDLTGGPFNASQALDDAPTCSTMHHRTRRCPCGILAFLLCAMTSMLGCTQSVYHLELEPDGDGLKRKLSVWNQSGSPPSDWRMESELLDRIKPLYDDGEFTRDGDKQIFSGRFVGEMPTDVGGWGSYTRFTSSLGATYVYHERFRGNDNLAIGLADRQKAADTITELLHGWIGVEIHDDALRSKLQTWTQTQLREDLRNLSLYIWLEPTEADKGEELLARLCQYLIERQYFSVMELPRLGRLIEEKNGHAIVAFFLPKLAKKIGLVPSEPLPESLTALSDMDYVEKSLNRYILTTEFYRERLASRDRPVDTNQDPLETLSSYLIFEMLFHGSLDQTSVVEVSLKLETEPTRTNGKWNADQRLVGWSETMDRSAVPTFCYAAWSLPDVQTQESLFGRVVADGASLESYVEWYNALAAGEANEWDAMLNTLTPDTAWKSLAAFEFSENSQLAIAPREILLKGLKATQP
jgi:hypothetical protein